MFPTLGHLLSYLTGTEITLGFPMFGFVVALSFLLAAWTLVRELERMMQTGLLPRVQEKVKPPRPASFMDYALQAIVGFLLGYKLGLLISDAAFFMAHPAEAIFSIQGYWPSGIALALVFVLLRYRAEKHPAPHQPGMRTVPTGELVGNITAVAAISGIIGAKIFHNLEYPEDFLADPVGALLSQGGLTFYGGLIFGTVAVTWFVWNKGLNPVRVADATAPGLMLAYAVGRIGCQLSGDGDWGIVNRWPKPAFLQWLPDWMWAFTYPHNVAEEGVPIPGCSGPFCMELPEPVFPTPIYETCAGLLLFAVLWSLRTRLRRPGLMFSVYLMFNGFERFWIEKIRVNSVYHIAGLEVTQAEIISTFLFLTGLAGLFLTRKYQSVLERLHKKNNSNFNPN